MGIRRSFRSIDQCICMWHHVCFAIVCMLDVCTFFWARLYVCVYVSGVWMLYRCVYIHKMFRIVAYLLFSNGTLFECRACSNVKKEEDTSSCMFLTHLAMPNEQHGPLHTERYIWEQRLVSWWYFFFTILLFFIRLINSIVTIFTIQIFFPLLYPSISFKSSTLNILNINAAQTFDYFIRGWTCHSNYVID